MTNRTNLPRLFRMSTLMKQALLVGACFLWVSHSKAQEEEVNLRVICYDAISDIKNGTEVGKAPIGVYGTNIQLTWQEGSFSEREAINAVNEGIAELGYLEPDYNYEFNGLKDVNFLIRIKIESLYGNVRGRKSEGHCRLFVSIVSNNFSKEQVYADTVTGSISKTNNEELGIPNANYFQLPIQYALYKKAVMNLLSRDEIQTLLGNDALSIASNAPAQGATLIQEVTALEDLSISNLSKSCATLLRGDGGHGSGFFISEDGYILTNAHVVGGNEKMKVKLSNGFEFEGEVVRVGANLDVALVKIPGSGFPALPVQTDYAFELGEEITNIGTPVTPELGQSVSKGLISGRREFDEYIYLQTDVAVSPGSSGSPLINTEGYVVGIVSNKIIGGGAEGIGFAVPADLIFEDLGLQYAE